MNVNEDVWGENALEFVPERWITSDGIPPKTELPYGWKGIMTFADGPRNCVGYRLGKCRYCVWTHIYLFKFTAVFELKIVLASLVRSLEFRKTDADIKYKIAQTLQPVVDGKAGIMPLFVGLAPGQEV
jgi:cytochrome P450